MTAETSVSPSTLVLRPGQVSLAELRRVSAGGVRLSLDPAALAGMQASEATVQRIVDEDQVVYGINTGFGKLASTKIAHDHVGAGALCVVGGGDLGRHRIGWRIALERCHGDRSAGGSSSSLPRGCSDRWTACHQTYRAMGGHIQL